MLVIDSCLTMEHEKYQGLTKRRRSERRNLENTKLMCTKPFENAGNVILSQEDKQ